MKPFLSLAAFLLSVTVSLAQTGLSTAILTNFNQQDFIITIPGAPTNRIRTVLEAHAPSTPGDQWYITIGGTNIFLLNGFMNPTVGFLPVRGATNFLDSPASADVVNGSLIVGSTGSAASRSTNYLYIPITSGTPAGTPATEGTHPAIVYDAVNDLLYAWNPPTGWHIIGTNIFYGTNNFTINPTDWKVPYRVNATTLGDTGIHPTNVNDMVFDGAILLGSGPASYTDDGAQLLRDGIPVSMWTNAAGTYIPSQLQTALVATNMISEKSMIVGGSLRVPKIFSHVISPPNDISSVFEEGSISVSSSIDTSDPSLITWSINSGSGDGALLFVENTPFGLNINSAFSLTNGTPQWDDGSKLITLVNGDWKPTRKGETILLRNNGSGWQEVTRFYGAAGGTGPIDQNWTNDVALGALRPVDLTLPVMVTNTIYLSSGKTNNLVVNHNNLLHASGDSAAYPGIGVTNITEHNSALLQSGGNLAVIRGASGVGIVDSLSGGNEVRWFFNHLWPLSPHMTLGGDSTTTPAYPWGVLTVETNLMSETVVTNGITLGGVRRTTWPSGGGASVNPTPDFIPYNNAGVFADTPFSINSLGHIVVTNATSLNSRSFVYAPATAVMSLYGTAGSQANYQAFDVNGKETDYTATKLTVFSCQTNIPYYIFGMVKPTNYWRFLWSNMTATNAPLTIWSNAVQLATGVPLYIGTNFINASAGSPTWNGAAWPGGGGGNLTVSGTGGTDQLLTWDTDTTGHWTSGISSFGVTNLSVLSSMSINITNQLLSTDGSGNVVGEDRIWTNFPSVMDNEGGTVYGSYTLNSITNGAFSFAVNDLELFYFDKSHVMSIGYPQLDVMGIATGNSAIINFGEYAGFNATFTNSSDIFNVGESAGLGGTFTNSFGVFNYGYGPSLNSTVSDSSYVFNYGEDAGANGGMENVIGIYNFGNEAGKSTFWTNTTHAYNIGHQSADNAIVNDSSEIYNFGASSMAGSSITTSHYIVNVGSSGQGESITNSTGVFAFGNGLNGAVINDSVGVYALGNNAGNSISGAYTNVVLIGDGATIGATGQDQIITGPNMSLTVGGTVTAGDALQSLTPSSPQTVAFSKAIGLTKWLVATGDVTIASSSLAAGAKLLLNIDNPTATNINVILPSGWRYVSGANTNILAASKIGVLSAISRAANDTNVVSLWSSE